MDFLIIIDNTLNQTAIYCFLAISVYISLRLLDFPDLSIEGTFPLGAAIAAILAQNSEFLGLSIPLAMLGGFVIGMVTASLHLYLKIGKLLSGILIAVGLYSINYRIMGAKANLYINNSKNLFSRMREIDQSWASSILKSDTPSILYPFSNLLFFVLLGGVIYLLFKFLKTEKGSLVRYSRSDTKFFLESIGVNYKVYVIFGLGLANAFAALSGALVAFQSGTASTTLGFGIILVALVSLVLGEQIVKVFHKDLTDLYPTILTPLVGTFIYYIIIRSVREFNTLWQTYSGYPDPSDQFQFFNSDIKILSVLIMILIYIFRREKLTSLNLPERL